MQNQIAYGDKLISYQVHVVADKAHRVAIHVHPDGSVHVDAPAHANCDDVKRAVLKRARWVVNHQSAMQAQLCDVLSREYVSGETHFYLGRRYQLKVLMRKQESVKLLRGRIVIATQDRSPGHVRDLLAGWYRARSYEAINRRFAALIGNLSWTNGVLPNWNLRNMRKQWGSCSPKGNISISPHLVKAPRDCIDYVLLHELAHQREHNHSKRFYRLLDDHMSDWRERKAKLDGMAGLLINE